ncbi:MAG TPA: ABC transporter permease subunit [Candidatus Acidoferrum sp.]|nr:ABC transporter permease subunit [Candidatus Acidoferrum sp.]
MQGLVGLLLLLILDASFSWARMLIALFISIVLSIAIGILAARSKPAGRVIIPVLDVLQTLPILAFFPFVIYIVVAALPNYIGINASVILLITTSMIWNIAFGVYESVSTIPNNLVEVSSLYRMGRLERLRKIFIPACMPRVAEQSVLSWAIGLFYLVTSEIFSTGSSVFAVKYGIGVEIASLAFSGNALYYAMGIGVFVAFVVATRFLLFKPFERYTSRYMEPQQRHAQARAAWRVRAFSGLASIHMPKIRIAAHRGRLRKAIPRLAKRGQSSVPYYVMLVVAAVVILSYIFVNYSYLWGYEVTAFVSLLASFARVWLAFGAICLVAVPISVYLIFISKKSSKYVTLFQILASIPATILLPAIVIGLANVPYHNEITAFVIFFISGVWYMIFGMLASARTISPEILEVKRVLGIREIRAWKSVYLGALLPGMITGGITAIAGEWNASIVAEYFTKTGISGTAVINNVYIGIGRLLDVSLASGNLALVATALINMTAMIIIVDMLVWKRLYKKVASIWG